MIILENDISDKNVSFRTPNFVSKNELSTIKNRQIQICLKVTWLNMADNLKLIVCEKDRITSHILENCIYYFCLHNLLKSGLW